MIQQEQANPSTLLPSGVMIYEAQKIINFLETGLMILPGSGRSDWPHLNDDQFDYIIRMHNRLAQMANLYSNPEPVPEDTPKTVPQGIDNA